MKRVVIAAVAAAGIGAAAAGCGTAASSHHQGMTGHTPPAQNSPAPSGNAPNTNVPNVPVTVQCLMGYLPQTASGYGSFTVANSPPNPGSIVAYQEILSNVTDQTTEVNSLVTIFMNAQGNQIASGKEYPPDDTYIGVGQHITLTFYAASTVSGGGINLPGPANASQDDNFPTNAASCSASWNS